LLVRKKIAPEFIDIWASIWSVPTLFREKRPISVETPGHLPRRVQVAQAKRKRPVPTTGHIHMALSGLAHHASEPNPEILIHVVGFPCAGCELQGNN
jgi:hypothetical protein